MLKKILFSLIIFMIAIGCEGKSKEKKVNKNKKFIVYKNFVSEVVKRPFKYYEIDSERAKKAVEDYFGHKNYKVIWNHIMGLNNTRIYFAVEELDNEKYFNLIKKGIIVREDGEVKAMFDPNIGVHNKYKDTVFTAFDDIGFKKDEVAYFSIGFSKWVNNKKNPELIDEILIDVYLLDDDMNAIGRPKTDKFVSFFTILVQKEINAKDFSMISDHSTAFESINELYKVYKNMLVEYRKSKKEGTLLKSPAVKKAFEQYKKDGLVQN